jgi:hypothetical protein
LLNQIKFRTTQERWKKKSSLWGSEEKDIFDFVRTELRWEDSKL